MITHTGVAVCDDVHLVPAQCAAALELPEHLRQVLGGGEHGQLVHAALTHRGAAGACGTGGCETLPTHV